MSASDSLARFLERGELCFFLDVRFFVFRLGECVTSSSSEAPSLSWDVVPCIHLICSSFIRSPRRLEKSEDLTRSSSSVSNRCARVYSFASGQIIAYYSLLIRSDEHYSYAPPVPPFPSTRRSLHPCRRLAQIHCAFAERLANLRVIF